MARPGITYEQVAQTCEALTASGRRPTLQAIRERLGTGSPNTIHMHLQAWTANRPAPPERQAELPTGILQSIQAEIERQRLAARADLQDKLEQAREEADELAKAGITLEGELGDARGQVADLTTERDRLAGQLEHLQEELATAQSAVARERQAAETARVELAKAQLRLEGNEQGLTDLRRQLEHLSGEASKNTEGRIAAERDLAAAAAARDTLQRQVTDLTAAAKEFEGVRKTLLQDLDEERLKRTQAEREAATAGERASGEKRRADDAEARERELRQEMTTLRRPAVAEAGPDSPPAGGGGKRSKTDKGGTT